LGFGDAEFFPNFYGGCFVAQTDRGNVHICSNAMPKVF
jgi:hypothetical protein